MYFGKNAMFIMEWFIIFNNWILNIKSHQYITAIAYSIYWILFKLVGSEFCPDLKNLDKGYLSVLRNKTRYNKWKSGNFPWVWKMVGVIVPLTEVLQYIFKTTF